MEHADGAPTYSQVVPIDILCANDDIRIYPTATANLVQIVLPEAYEDAAISVLDGMGSIVAVPASGIGRNRKLQLGPLPTGPYLIMVKSSSGVRTFRVIHQ